MKITVNTREDSIEDINRAISFLQGIVDGKEGRARPVQREEAPLVSSSVFSAKPETPKKSHPKIPFEDDELPEDLSKLILQY